MNILILGYGKMGKTIEQVALKRGHNILATVDLEHREQTLAKLNPKEVDVAIEFSQPDSAPSNIRYCLKNGIAVVSGTTGWLKERRTIEDYCIEHNGTFFYASNFSIGVNLFFKLNKLMAAMMDNYTDYQPRIEETHHTQKKDEPSGTAITVAEGMLMQLHHKNDWYLDGDEVEQEHHQIPIKSIREGDVPGTHTVSYRSEIDDIEIKHTAHGRQGFALGAVLVAEWIKNKKGNLGMDDFLKI